MFIINDNAGIACSISEGVIGPAYASHKTIFMEGFIVKEYALVDWAWSLDILRTLQEDQPFNIHTKGITDEIQHRG